jgi:16S rRNA pseudouridine516 synthase
VSTTGNVLKPVRLARLLANCGVGSRSQVDILIRRGHAVVDGTQIRDPAYKVHPAQFGLVTFADEPLDHPFGVTILLHKPVGYSCSHDASEAPTVDELLPPSWAMRTPRPEWAGRLDRDTSGLLLISDDHQMIHRVTSPKHHVIKRYEVTLAEPFASADALDAAVEAFASGALMLEGDPKPCLPAVLLRVASGDPLRVDVELREGRYHQVRRMIAAVGGHVTGLHRSSFGEWTLAALGAVGSVAPGEWVDIV